MRSFTNVSEKHIFLKSVFERNKEFFILKIGNTSASDRQTDGESSAKPFNNKAIYIDAQKNSKERTGLRCQRVIFGGGGCKGGNALFTFGIMNTFNVYSN